MHHNDGIGENSIDHGGSGTDGTPPAKAARRGFDRWIAVFVVVVAYAWWVVSLQPFSGKATAAVLVSGVSASAVGRARRRPGRRWGSTTAVGPWAGLAVLAVALELLAWVQHPRADHPTLSSLTNAMLDSQPARAAAFVLWLLAMVELGRR